MSVEDTGMPSESAKSAFLQAVEIMETVENLDERQLRDVVSLLKVAVRDAGIPFPLAEALLGMTYISLGDTNSAKKYANMALEHNPLELRAQLVKVDISMQNLQVMEGNAVSLLPSGIGAKYLFAAIFRMVRALFVGGAVANTQVRFRGEVAKLIEIFQELFAQEQPAEDFLFFASRFIAIADVLQSNNVLEPARQLSLAVASVSLSNLIYDGSDFDAELKDEVAKIRRIAQGRA
jgi:hypothetical protein